MKLTLAALIAVAFVVCATSAGATTIRTPSGYGILDQHQGSAAPSTGSSVVTDALYQCTYGTPCPVDLDSCSSVFSDTTDTGAAPCFDLFLTISAPVEAGTTITVTVPGFTDTSDQFGLFECGSDPTAQGFGGICTPAADVPAGCSPTTVSVSADGTFSLPSACLAEGVTFFLDETTDAAVTVDVEEPTTTAPEPSSLALLTLGLLPLAYFSRRQLKA